MAAMLAVVREFRGLPHRCEFVRSLDGVDYINDSKGTNVGATVAAIQSLMPEQGQVVLIAGGDGKGADFSPMAEPVARCCRRVLVLGADADRLASALADTVPVERVGSLDEAVARARAVARPGDRVLLSPACASFDMFRDYQDRGDQFRQRVEALL